MTQIKSTTGQRVSDFFAKLIRSWLFVLCQIIFITIWIIANSFHIIHFDPWPFDGLKLILTIEASFFGSMILMSQNRISNIDRNIAYQDFIVDRETKKEVSQMLPMVQEDHIKMNEVLDLLKKDNLLPIKKNK